MVGIEASKGSLQAPGSDGHRALRRLALGLWLTMLLLFGVLLLVLTILPNLTPVTGVLNKSGRPVGLDFISFYAAGSLARAGQPGAAYDDQSLFAAESAIAGTSIHDLRWPYPPGLLPAVAALARLPYLSAFAVWLGTALATLAFVLWRLSGSIALALFLPLFPAVSYAAMTSQFPLLAAAIAGAGLLLLHDRPGWAGFLFGLLTLKLQLALLLPFCLWAGREKRAFFVFLATAVGLQIAGIAFAGGKAFAAFLAAASGMLGHVADSTNLLARAPTVFAALVFAGMGLTRAIALQLIASLASIAVASWIWRRSSDRATRALAWAAGAPLAAPYLFDYDLAIFAVPLAGLVARGSQQGLRWTEAAVISLLWSAAPLLNPLTDATGWQLGPWASALLLAFALHDSVRAQRFEPPIEPRSPRTARPPDGFHAEQARGQAAWGPRN
jgi:alpha-1,2-mannosyltransferase